jgi:DNA-binding transcriptional regulator GbsR (MarR family)
MDREEYKRFIEQAADVLDEDELPHMAGRVIGALLVCVPPYMSLDELAEDVQASKGAISMATQLLLRLGFIERISLPGERRHYYGLRPNFLEDVISERTEHILRHRLLFEAGMQLLRDEPMEAKSRLIELQAYLDFLADELPGLSERWRNRRDELIRRQTEEMT